MSWLDLLLVCFLATFTVLGVERRLFGLFIGLGGVFLLKPVLLLTTVSPWLALVIALIAGLLLGFAGQRLLPPLRTPSPLFGILGGIGGFALGLVLVLALVTSLPIERNFSNQIVYPPRHLPEPVGSAVLSSRLVSFGRGILLYPLLDGQGDVPTVQRELLKGFHRLLVVGEPWAGR